MNLAPDFQFSQGSLQDLADCARRFELRYIERLAWPAVEAAPQLERERDLQLGAQFHRLAQQHLLGVPVAPAEARLAGWWSNFLTYAPALWGGEPRPARPQVEVELSAPLAGRRLLARYDLVLLQPGPRAVIVDWKTSPRPTPRAVLERRWQTRVYPYVLALAGGALTGGQPLAPTAIEMVYWFAAAPRAPERFIYNVEQFERDGRDLTAAAHLAEALAPGGPDRRTADERLCRFCVYRSLCERGLQAGAVSEADGPLAEAADFDFDSVEPIEF